MNEELIRELYNGAKSLGYKDSPEDFVKLLHTNNEFFNEMFSYAKSNGYNDTEDDFSVLIGKKKDVAAPVAQQMQPSQEPQEGMASPSGATSLESPSGDGFSKALSGITADLIDLDEEEVFPKLNEMFREQGFKFIDTGLGDQIEVTAPKKDAEGNPIKKVFKIDMWTRAQDEQVANEIKSWMQQNKRDFEVRKAEVSESDFSKSIQSIDKDLASKDEDYIIPQLKAMFGDYGFGFSTTAVGDNVIVEAPDGKKTTIPVDRWTEAGNIESSDELKKFIEENKPVLPKLADQYNIYESRIRTEKDLENVKKAFNDEVNNLRKAQTNAVIENAWIEKEYNALNSVPESQRNTTEFTERVSSFQERVKAFQENAKTIVEREKDIEKKSAQLDASIGRYVSMSANQGQFFEGAGLTFLGGYGGMSAAATNIMFDIGNLFGGGAPFSSKLDGSRAIQLAIDNKIDVPQELLVSPDKWNDKTAAAFDTWFNSIPENQKTDIKNKISDENLKKVKGEALPYVRNALVDALGSGETKAEYLKSGGFLRQSVYGLVGSVPAMLSGPPAVRALAFGLQGFDATMQEMSSPEFDDYSESEKYAVAIPIAILNGVLEEFGFRNVIGNSAVTMSILSTVFNKTGSRASASTFKEFVENEVKDRIARGALTLTGAGLAEAETGGLQALGEASIKQIFNWNQEKNLFQTPSSVSEWLELVGESAAMEAVGGVMMGAPSAISTAISENNYNGVTDKSIKLFSLMADDPNFKQAFTLKIKQEIVSGKMTEENGKALLESYDKGASAIKSMPEGLSDAAKRKAVALIIEKNDLAKKIEGKDEAMVKKEKQRIAEINKELEKVSEMKEKALAPNAPKPVYSINGTQMSRDEWAKTVEAMTPEELKNAVVDVKNATPEDVDFINKKAGVTGISAESNITPAAAPAPATEAKPITAEQITNPDVKSEINELIGVYETMLANDEARYNEKKAEWDKKGIFAKAFGVLAGTKPSYNEAVSYAKSKLDMLRNNPEAFFQQKLEDHNRELQDLGEPEPDAWVEYRNNLEIALQAIKEEQDAIQKQAAGQVPVQQAPTAGEAVAQGVPAAGPEVTPTAGAQAEEGVVSSRTLEEQVAALEQMMTEEETNDVVQQFGSPVQSTADAEAAMSRGDFVYVTDEATGTPTLVSDVTTLSGYTPDQMVVVAKENMPAVEAAPAPAMGPAMAPVAVSNKAALDTLKAQTTDTTKRRVIGMAEKAINTLKSVFPDMDINIHTTAESYNQAMRELKGTMDSAGNFAAIGDRGIRIDINLSKASGTTVAHEVAHAIMLKTFGDNPALFKKFRNRILKVLSESRINELNEFADQYAEEVSHEEFMVQLTGMLSDNSEQLSRIEPTTIQKIADAINQFVSYVTKGRLVPFEGTVRTNQLVDFLNTMSTAITKGEEVTVTEKTKGAVTKVGVASKAQKAAKDIPMSASNVLYADSDILPKPTSKISNAAVAKLIANVAADFWGGSKINSITMTPEQEELIVDNGIEETEKAFLSSGKNAADWYSTAIETAIEVAGVIHPELTSKESALKIPYFAKEKDPVAAAQMVMRMALAITSQNINVEQNAKYAEEQFDFFKKNGRFDSNRKYGAKAKSISSNLELVNIAISKIGNVNDLEGFIKSEFTVNDLESAFKNATGKSVKISGLRNDIVNGAAIFGPKIGQGFLQNLMGNFMPVTIDLWMRRTWGRWTGDVVGHGVTEDRVARLINSVKEANRNGELSERLPSALLKYKQKKVVDKKGKVTTTMDEDFVSRVEEDADFVNSINASAKKIASLGDSLYKLIRYTPMSKEIYNKFISGDLSYVKAAKKLESINKNLNTKYAEYTLKEKQNKRKPIKKADWMKAQYEKMGMTITPSNEDIAKRKPEWVKAATVIKNELNPIDIPSNADRRVITRVVNKIREGMAKKGYLITNADVQALLWYPEKDIWSKLRGEQESNLKLSYDDEFIKIAEQRGLGDQAKKAAERVRSRRSKSVVRANEQRREGEVYGGVDQYVSKSQLAGPTAGNRLFNEPLKEVASIADRYYKRVFGRTRPKYTGTKVLDKDRSKRISDAFIKMKHDPFNPEVKRSYDALAKEVIDQYKAFLDAGYSIEINNEESYNNSQEMIDDLRNNNRIKILSTESGFGSKQITDAQRRENPMLNDSGFKDVNGITMLVNDVFRAIHDFYGHAELGNSFGPKGEENAWNVHARMFSPLARKAMTTETRGQNSYVNFSGVNDEIEKLRDQARERRKNGDEKGAQKIVEKIYELASFADQKIGLLPEEFYTIDETDTGDMVVSKAQVSAEGAAKDKYRVSIVFKSKFGGRNTKTYEFNDKRHFDNWLKKNGDKYDISEIYELKSKAQKKEKPNIVEFDYSDGETIKVNLDDIEVSSDKEVDFSNNKWNKFNIKHKENKLGYIEVKLNKTGDLQVALSSIYSFKKDDKYKGPLEPIIKIITKALSKIFPKMFSGNVVVDVNRGKGLGTKAYGLLARQLKEQYGKDLISDTSRSDAAEALWRSLERKGLAKVVGDRDNAEYRWQYYYKYIVPDTQSEVKELEKMNIVSKAQVDAYHGSPYDFDEFTLSKIGTGEGAQAFGWGLYFTDIKSIAESYANKLSASRAIKYKGKTKYELEGKHPMVKMFLLDLEQSNPKTKNDALNWLEKNKKGKSERVINELSELINDISIGDITKRVYQVTIHQGKTPDQYTWLEWDKPVSEKAKKSVLDFISKDDKYTHSTWLDAKKKIKYDLENNLYAVGEDLYKRISGISGLSPKQASLFLLDAGIDGVKYPAESIARGAKSDTARGFNYVVFDDKAITIVSKAQKRADAKKAVQKTVANARAQGFSEEAIRIFLGKRGFSQDDIDEFMKSPEAAKKVEVTEELAPGYDRMMEQVDGIIETGLEVGSTQEEIMNDVIQTIKSSDAYKNATDIQKDQMLRDAEEAFGQKQKAAPRAERGSFIYGLGRLLGFAKKEVKMVTVPEYELLIKGLKDYIKGFAKGEAEGKKAGEAEGRKAGEAKGRREMNAAWKRAYKSLSNDIRALRKSGKISTKQAVAVIRRFSSVNIFDPTSIDSFVNYMTKVFANAEYAEKVAGLRKKLKLAKDSAKRKLGIAEGLYPMLDRMLSIDPTLVPDDVLNEYAEIVEMLGKRDAVLLLKEINDVTQKARTVLDAIDTELSILESLKDIFDQYPNKVLDSNGDVDFAETVSSMISDGTITEDDAKVLRKYKSKVMPRAAAPQKTEQQLQDEKDEMIMFLQDADVDADRLPTRDERDTARELAELIQTSALGELSNAELKKLLLVVSNINNGYLTNAAQLMKERLNSIPKSKTLSSSITKAKPLPISAVYSKIKAYLTRKKNAIEVMGQRNPFFYIDQVFGDFKTKDIYNSLFSNVAKAMSTFDTSIQKIEDRLNNAIDSVAMSHNNDPDKTSMSSYKMMAYMLQLEHESNPGSTQVNPAAEYLKATIKHIRNGKSHLGDRDADMLQDILDKYSTNDQIDKDRLYDSFNSAEKSALKTIKDINIEMRDKAVFTAHIIRGDKLNPITNYVHHHVMPDDRPDDSIAGISSAEEFNNLMNPSTRGKSLISRTKGVKPLDFDVFSATQRGANYVLMDYHLTEPIRTARKAINMTEKTLEEGGMSKKDRDVFNAIKNSFEGTVRNTLATRFHNNTFMDLAVKFMTKQGYRAVLASTTRFIAELSSNMGFMLIVDPKGWINGVKNYRNVAMSTNGIDIMMNVRSSVTSRIYPSDTLSGRMIDSSIMSQASGIKGGAAKSAFANATQRIYNNSLKKVKNFVEVTADGLISTPDKIMMRPYWFGAFATEFKKITGENPDFDLIASNNEAYMTQYKDAIKASTSMADEKVVFAGASSNPFMGVMKGQVTPNMNSLVKAFNTFNGYMTTFLMYEYATARTGIMAAIGDGYITRKQGAAMLAGVATRMVTYTLLSSMLGEELVGMFVDEEDEEDEKSLSQKVGQSMLSGATSLIVGRDFGNATRSVLNYGVERMNEEFLGALRNGEYDPYKDAIAYSPLISKGETTTLQDYAINMLGPLTPSLKTGTLIVKKLTEEPKKEKEAIERREKEIKLRIPLEVLGNLGYVPLYKDIRRIVLADIYKDLKKNKDKKSMGGGAYNMNKEDMKRYFPEMYEAMYGEGSAEYEYNKAMKKYEDEMKKMERRMKDEMYNYKPKQSD